MTEKKEKPKNKQKQKKKTEKIKSDKKKDSPKKLTKMQVKLALFEELQQKRKNNSGAPKYPFTQELADEICRLIATTTTSITNLCKTHPELPGKTIIYEWRVEHPKFAEQYLCAMMHRAHLLAEECLEISDDSDNDTKIDKRSGQKKIDAEWVSRSRLKIDTRKWLAGKMLPKLYGDKIQVENQGARKSVKEVGEQMAKIKKYAKPY